LPAKILAALVMILVASPLKGDGLLTAVGDKPRRYLNLESSPIKIVAQFFPSSTTD
jgi:hypothetical protein